MARSTARLRSVAGAAICAASALAQNNLGILQNLDVSYAARGNTFQAGAFPSTQYTRIDSDFIAAWGHDDTNPGFRTVFGVHCFLQDANGATADPFQLLVYTESSVLSAMPDVNSPLLATGNMSMPIGAPGPAAFEVSALFLTPVALPGSADAFFGVHQTTPSNVLAQDGMSVWLTTAEDGQGLWTVRDLPGAGAPTTGASATFAGFRVPATGQTAFLPRSQFHIEPLLATPGGIGSAYRAGDVLHPAAGVFPGTSCMLSGLRPDVRAPSANPARADDLGMTFLGAGWPNNSPVLWLGELAGSFGPETPLSWVLPGASGALCVNPANVVVIGVGWSANGRASHLISIPTSVRSSLTNLTIVQQAVSFHPNANAFLAGPCQLSAL